MKPVAPTRSPISRYLCRYFRSRYRRSYHSTDSFSQPPLLRAP
jgi:hypothetical protein